MSDVTFVRPPHGLEELRQRFGAIEVRSGAIIGPPGWESRNMHTVVDLPGWEGRLYLNNALEPPLREALRRCVALGDGYQIHTLGCFAPRPKRTNPDQLSVHSWGMAIDIGAAENPLIAHCPPGDPRRATWAASPTRLPQAWIDVFKAVGWTWGGDFEKSFDPMHLQWASGC